MIRILTMIAVAGALACVAAPARADFSACSGALVTKDPQQQVDLYTTCLKHGGLMKTDAAGAFNNRGVAYQHLGEVDKALQDFIWATEDDPNWPLFRVNRATAEAQKGQCAEALADMAIALKMAPHNKQYIELRNRLLADCPIQSRPPS